MPTPTPTPVPTPTPTPTPFPGYDPSVLQHHKENTRAGNYIETTFSKTAVAGLHIDSAFSAPVNGPVYAQPLFLDGAGGRDMLFVATEQNHVIAMDASSGSVIWDKFLGSPVSLSDLPCGNISTLGITGTPIIDANSRRLYVDAMTTPDGGSTKRHLIYALNIDTGSVVAGWPLDVNSQISYGGMGFDSSVQNERGALALLNGNLYVPYGGHWGDCGNYRGWVVAVPVNNPSSATAWATGAQAGGIWGPSGLASDGFSIFAVTGNTMGTSTWNGGEAIIRFSPTLNFSGSSSDFYAPTNWVDLDNADLDMAASGLVLVSVPGASPSNLALSLGKDGNAYLLDPSNLGGISDPISLLRVATSEIRSPSAAYTVASGTYVSFNITGSSVGCPSGQSGNLVTVKISATSPPSLSVAWCQNQHGEGAPIVSTTDGTANPIVWGLGAESSNRLYGFDGVTGQVIFNGGGSAELMSTVQHYQTPIIAKGKIYVPANNRIYRFTVP